MEFEKYSLRQINKDIDPNAIESNGDRKFLPGMCIDALNCSYTQKGSAGVTKNIKGNLLKNFALNGNNRVLGAFLYQRYNTVVYVIWNEDSDHKVVEYDPQTDTFITLLSGSSLKFNKDYCVSHGGIIDDILILTDGLNNTMYINILKAKAGFYTAPYPQEALSLLAIPPLKPLSCTIVSEAGRTINKLTNKTFQFSYRYIYYDNRKSVLSPQSKLQWSKNPSNNIALQQNNAIDVVIPFDVGLTGIITEIEVFFRIGNDGYCYLFKTIKAPNQSSYTERFYNDSNSQPIALAESDKLYDAISPVVDSLKVIDGRVFSTVTSDGFDIDESTFDITFTIQKENVNFPTQKMGNNLYLKRGGSYLVGIVFTDFFGKTSFVKKQKTIEVPFNLNQPDGSTLVEGVYVTWQLSGTPPAGMKTYQLVLSPNNLQMLYYQCVTYPRLYVRDLAEGEKDSTIFDETFSWLGKLFCRIDTNNFPSYLQDFNKVYLQFPVNIPFTPDSTCIVRLSDTSEFGFKFVNVVDVINNFMVLDSAILTKTTGGLVDWRDHKTLLIEVFKEVPVTSNRFYEIGDVYDIINVNFSVVSGNLYGDTYFARNLINNEYDKFVPVNQTGNTAQNTATSITPDFTPPTTEVMTIVTNSVNVRVASQFYFSDSAGASLSGTLLLTVVTSTTLKTLYSLDLTKISSNFGRVHTVYDKEKKSRITNIVAYSNIYIQGTSINGINEFDAVNRYTLPIERGTITGFAKNGKVLLTFHERNVSSLYIGDGVLKEGENFLLTKSSSVIGDDRPMLGGYGTIKPESILEVYDSVFFWDSYRGAFLRYTNAGTFPISHYGMRDYFIRKGRAILKYNHKVITGFDYFTDEVLLTFTDATDTNGNVIVPGETWAFNIHENKWTTRYSFVPEYYASFETDLISFKDGRLWMHYKNLICNNFYGVQYTRKFKIAANPAISKNKKLLNIHIKGEIAQDINGEFVPVKISTPNGQESFIPSYEFELDEDKYTAGVLKDVNTPGMSENQLALRSGDDMVAPYFIIEVENDRTDESPFSEINVIYKTEKFSI